MIYTEKKQIPSKVVEKQHELPPCLNCGYDDLKVEEYEDTYGFISTVTCKKCKRESRVQAGVLAAITKWKSENDIDTVVELKSSEILTLRQDISDLKKLKQSRKSKKGA